MLIPKYIDIPAYIILTILGLIMCLWGKQLSRVISSIVFAAFLGYTVWLYSFRIWGSIAVSIILMLIAMAVGFVVGFIVFKFAISMFFAYIIAGMFAPKHGALFLLLLIVFTAVMYVLANYILSLLFTATGTLMIYEGVTVLGLEKMYALIICVIVFVLGLYNQVRSRT